MTRAVSVVIPALGDTALLAAALPPLFAEVARRGLADEVIVVDDTGADELSGWLRRAFPAARCVVRERNGGFARALHGGVEAAARELVFSMNSDVIVRPGFLEPLIASLDDERVFAAAPRVLLGGDEGRVESLTRLALSRGMVEVVQPGLASGAERGAVPRGDLATSQPIAFAVGGTFLFRRAEFLARGGFDPLYEPFYWEDVDFSWSARRAGRSVLYEPASVVEHRHRGTIAKHGQERWIRAAIERNRLLFQWKHLDGPALEQHLAALLRWIVDAYLAGEREELVWLALAFDQVEAALEARAAAARAGSAAGFEALARKSAGR